MKNRYLVIAIILITLITGSNAFARVLPVNEEMESQEDFIIHNIDMPDLSGTSEYIVQEYEILTFEYTSNSRIEPKYKINAYSNLFLTLIPELTISEINVE